ncbi:M42 family metallopeptidase [Fimbriimonas ginsengisoli]|uniref:Cellulase n=1 Tax=Fimbriimonas ginsengisoli Gsoil 348 TaxID=661478 RepID=A0A068NUF6_FIMGI|nr:M42 family metallopeptidase [Fimbriimonas ginsengisoli]AIE87158.1 cellulase [Fimbriimonas ginsengisoli Gsoil 348]
MNIDLLQELTEAHGVSGREDAIREIVRRELGPLGELSSDSMGNVICVKRGSGGGKKVMIAAHMDEIGFCVKFIDDKGFVRLQTLGGWDPRQMNAQRVIVGTKDGPLRGVLMYSSKPAHLLTEGEKKGQNHDEFFVDLGLSGEEAKAKVRIGDPVTMDRGFFQLGNLLTCKTMDDRVGVFVMIEAIKALGAHEVDVYAVATVQEEVGLRGAAAAGWSVQPDIAIALDITLANDIPGLPEQDQITRLGQGAAIKVMDSSLICHPKVVDHFRDVAEAKGIKYQLEVLSRGGTDAGAIQRLHGGIPSFTLSIPTRYVHTVNETVHGEDVQACIDLLACYLEDAHSREYGY